MQPVLIAVTVNLPDKPCLPISHERLATISLDEYWDKYVRPPLIEQLRECGVID